MAGMQILHLEDDAFDADLVRRAFGRLSLQPDWVQVGSVEEFHAALAGNDFDAVLSDHSVPGIEGLDALAEVRARRPNVPFVFVSGNADPRWAEHCIEAGATDYVPKEQLWRLPGALMRMRAARESERLARQTLARTQLVDIVKKLSLCRTVDAIVDVVRQSARLLSGADGASVVLRDGDKCHYVDEDAISPLWKGGKFPMDSCISGWSMMHRQAAVIADVFADPRIPHDVYRKTFVKSLVMVPIRAEAPIGAIGAYWAREHEAQPDDVDLMQALADSTSLAFETVAAFEGLERRVEERTAELAESNRALEAFSYSVSHDLRAPLRAVRGYLELLTAQLQPPPEGAGAVYLSNIRKSADRMDALIEDMMTLAKVTRTEVRRRPVPIGVMARGIIDQLQADANARRAYIDIDEAMLAHGDAGLIRLALDNLLTNAWKFTSKCEETRIRVGCERNSAAELVFSVSDNGAGFDMARAQNMFEPFRRLHSEAEFAGTGVGLAIVRQVVQKHGGRIWADAKPGLGATFHFTLA